MKPTTRNPAIAAAYVRVSTGVQQHSIAAQNTRLERHLELNQITLSARFEDEDVSGRKPLARRPGGAALLEHLRKHPEVGTLVVSSLDRLGRNAIDIQRNYQHITRELGIGIHILDFGGKTFDSSDLMADFFITVLAALAQLEVERTRKRIKDVLDDKFHRGESLGGQFPPYGFDRQPTGATRTRKDGGIVHIQELVNHPEEQAVIFQVAAHRAAGCSVKACSDWLNENGIPTKTGQRWTSSRLDRVLRSKHTQRLLASRQAAAA